MARAFPFLGVDCPEIAGKRGGEGSLLSHMLGGSPTDQENKSAHQRKEHLGVASLLHSPPIKRVGGADPSRD